jgi:hypothetical protein
MSELTVDFDEPYIGGAAGGGPSGVIPPWAVAINNRRYLLDTASGEYRREGIDVVQQRNTSNQRDTLLLPQDIWRQQFESWHQGAGQQNADRDESLPYRFHRSYGIDPWTKYQLSLLNETRQLMTLSTVDPTFVQVHNGWLVVVHDDGSFWFETPTSTVEMLALGPTSGKAISITYDGDAVIVLTGTGKVFRLSDSNTSTAVTVTPPTGTTPAANPIDQASFIAYVKDYLILGVGNQLWDITATQAKLIYTSPVTGFTWKGAAEGQNAIYLVGGSGDKHLIHRVGVKQDGTGLEPAVVAAALPDGEEGVSIGTYLGYAFIGSNRGLRMATPSSAAGDLTLGALLPTLAPVYGFEGQDRFVWATASIINPVPDAGQLNDAAFPSLPVCGLYRTDLSTFTVTDSTPAYATDIVAPNEHGKIVRSVTTWNDKRVFSVDGGGVYLETDVKMAGGWLAQGRVSFSVEDIKTGLYAQGKWEPLHGTVAFDIAYDNNKPLRVMNWSIPGSIRSGNITLNGKQFSRVDLIYTLYRDAVNTRLGPDFTRFEIRARAAKGAASRWYLPIINHEELDLNGVIEARDVTAEFLSLMNLVETGVMFPLQEWGRTYYVVVKDFRWQPQKLNLDGSGWQGVFLLIVEEAR